MTTADFEDTPTVGLGGNRIAKVFVRPIEYADTALVFRAEGVLNTGLARPGSINLPARHSDR